SPSGEHRSFTSDDADPGIVVVLETVNGRLHAFGHIAVDGVARLGAADGYDCDVSVGLVFDHDADASSAMIGRISARMRSTSSGLGRQLRSACFVPMS